MNSDWKYAAWRFEMWVKGYGTYVEIEKAVEAGELVPGRVYPTKAAQQGVQGRPEKDPAA